MATRFSTVTPSFCWLRWNLKVDSFLPLQLNIVGAVTHLYSKHRECCTVIFCRDLFPNTVSVLAFERQSQPPDPFLSIFCFLSILASSSEALSLLTNLWAWLTKPKPLDTLPVMILELVSCQGLSRRASTIHPTPGSRNISWLISNLVRKWVSAFLLQGTGLGPAYLAAYTGKSLILLDLGCGREAFNAIISRMMVSHSSAVPSHTGVGGGGMFIASVCNGAHFSWS